MGIRKNMGLPVSKRRASLVLGPTNELFICRVHTGRWKNTARRYRPKLSRNMF